GYGGVFNWPRQWFELPLQANIAFHYNTSENFVPATDRVDQYRRPVPSPTGVSKDYGVSVYLWDNKLVARFNWFNATLGGATAAVSSGFNQNNANILTHFCFLNRDIMRMDANNDDIIDEWVYEEVEVVPATGLTDDGLTREEAVAA